MDCRQHPGTAAVANCSGCAESFCPNCVVTVRGKPYCASCKTMAISPDMGPSGVCEEANEALKYAVIGIFCFQFILGPAAIVKGIGAKKVMAANPRLEGQGKATIAIVLGVIELLMCLVYFATRFSDTGR